MGTIEQTGVDDRRPTTNETKMKTMMMLTTWMMLCLLLIGACAQAPPTPQDAPAAPATEDAPAAPAADAGDQGASGAVDSAETAEKPETIGEDCLPNENNEFVFKVNLWEYQYEVEGCEGVAPTLKIKRGVEYTFVQEDVSNWYHPLGLAYYPDGAHTGVPELEEPTPAECDEAEYMCNPGDGVQQAPLYCINGECEAMSDWNNGVTSGLDVYEPVFQRPEDQWEEEGEASYAVKFTIPTDSKTAEFYYFCHIHSGMSAKIVVENPAEDANQLVTPLAADYYGAPPEEFDVQCGTYDNVTEFHTEKDTYCPGQSFLCETTGSPFSQCMEAIDCKMNYEMRVQEKDENKLAVFMEQMIPHHWNAILMSRIALKHATDAEGFEDEELNVPQLMRNIINVQMQQIQQMQTWLETYAAPTVVCPAA